MLYSVIIPIYNAEKTLRRCLDSLLPQMNGQAELILVNDGSTDGSDEICREYAASKEQICYIRQENGGVSAARNRGLAAASGAYVSFVDSDDLVSSDYFDVLAEEPEADLLVFGERLTRNGSVMDSILPSSLVSASDYDEFTAAFVRSRNGSPCNKRFRRAILTDNGIVFPEGLRIGEDFVFCLRYLMQAKTAAATERCAYIIDESDSQSNSRKYNADICSQALQNYRCAFDAVLSSALEQPQKDRLTQILDYNYYRTAFACVQELFKADLPRRERLRRTKQTLVDFAAEDRGLPAGGLTHRLEKLVVKRKLSLAAYAIARLHRKTGAAALPKKTEGALSG